MSYFESLVPICLYATVLLSASCSGNALLGNVKEAAHLIKSNLAEAGDEIESLLQKALSNDVVQNISETQEARYIYSVYGECLNGCWDYIFNDDALIECVYSKKGNCLEMRNEDVKDLLLYYSTLVAGVNALQAPGRALELMLSAWRKEGSNEDEDGKGQIRMFIENGIKLAGSVGAAKLVELTYAHGKDALMANINSRKNITYVEGI